MWSNKKAVNIVVNILLFLLAINIFHYGQLLLPIICLILFIDNRCKFYVSRPLIFILLCLFGISFYVFSYKMGFYSVVGFCLPMAYYIGSNIKEVSNNSIKELIYVFAFGMATHMVLNFVCDLVTLGKDIFTSYSHYDIWLMDKVSTTNTAVNCVMIIGCVYYILFYEKSNIMKIVGTSLFGICMLYDIGLGRRTPIVMFICVFGVLMFIDLFVNKNKEINRKKLRNIVILVSIVIVSIILVYVFNINDIREKLSSIRLIDKFQWQGLNTMRIGLFLKALQLAPSHLLGGQEISKILEWPIHDLWMDTFDYAGIVPFVLLVIYSIISFKNVYSFIKIAKDDKKSLTLFLGVLISTILILLLEPIMTGSSIFLICITIIGSVIERKVINNGK